MGSADFIEIHKGKTMQEAFNEAREQAAWEHGHGGYTGTIAEKHDFIQIAAPDVPDIYGFVEEHCLHSSNHHELDSTLRTQAEKILDAVDDKWGPAGAIDLGDNRYLFFGWASC